MARAKPDFCARQPAALEGLGGLVTMGEVDAGSVALPPYERCELAGLRTMGVWTGGSTGSVGRG